MVQRNLSSGNIGSAKRFLPRGLDVAVVVIVYPLSRNSSTRQGCAASVAYTVPVAGPAPPHPHEQATLGAAQEVLPPVQTAVVLLNYGDDWALALLVKDAKLRSVVTPCLRFEVIR